MHAWYILPGGGGGGGGGGAVEQRSCQFQYWTNSIL